MLLAWPPVLDLLMRALGTLRNKQILDFGCGAGHFCRKLSLLGAKPTGVDPSPAMVAAARKVVLPETEIHVGDMSSVRGMARFDAFTALMTFPYLLDLTATLTAWSRLAAPGAAAAIVVYNPGFVRELMRAGKRFLEFDSVDRPRRGIESLPGGSRIPVTIRYAEEYAYAMETHGFHLTFEARPPFTADFLARYPQDYPTKTPEFLIMGFRHQSA